MKILGHGIDLAPTDRIQQMVERHGERFLNRCFTQAERGYAEGNVKRTAEHLAARFAAKEAVLKAIGTGWRDGIAWTDIEVVREPSGRPVVHVSGEVAKIAEAMGVTDWMLSLTHTETHAVASVIAVG